MTGAKDEVGVSCYEVQRGDRSKIFRVSCPRETPLSGLMGLYENGRSIGDPLQRRSVTALHTSRPFVSSPRR